MLQGLASDRESPKKGPLNSAPYGRGGVGRGVGETLGVVLGLGVVVDVGVALTLGVAVAVGVGVRFPTHGLTSQLKFSMEAVGSVGA